MRTNQIETGNLRLASDARTAARGSNLATSAFTLTELLVVITIIAILAALITVAGTGALDKVAEGRIIVEIQQLSNEVEDFKNTYGAYPPNAMIPSGGDPTNNFLGNDIRPIVQTDLQLVMKRAFARNKELISGSELDRRLVGDSTVGGTANAGGYLEGGMNAAEALVFWLGGFSDDTSYPISGQGGPAFGENDGVSGLTSNDEFLENRNWSNGYEFDLGRLGPRNDDGTFAGRWIEYQVNGETRRINFWTYAPDGSEQPLLYTDTSRHNPNEYDVELTGSVGPFQNARVFAMKKIREGFSGTPTVGDIRFVNSDQFQILHCGIDDFWGDYEALKGNVVSSTNPTDMLLFPTGPFLGDMADNLGNFMTGNLEDSQEE